MSIRTAKLASAIFVSVLASAGFAEVSHAATSAADTSCLPGPKGVAPQGGHWYYRVDRATKRHCWYVGDEKQKPSKLASQDSPARGNPAPQPKETQRSLADARAELPMPPNSLERETDGTTTRGTAVNPANSAPANAEDPGPSTSPVASRWPDSSGVTGSAAAALATGMAGVNAKESPKAGALASVTLAAADSSEKSTGSMPMLLIVVIGALSVAGLVGSAIYRLGGRRSNDGRKAGLERRAIWDLPDSDHAPAAIDAADDPRRRLAAMMARLSHGTAA